MPDTLDQILRRTAALVYQPEGRSFSDAELKEFINAAQQSTMLELAARGVTSLRMETTEYIPAGMTVLSFDSIPSLPENLVSPIRLMEKFSGAWLPMSMVKDHLPQNAVPNERLFWWDWRGSALRFVGSTATIEILIDYTARLEDFTMPHEGVGLPDLVNILSYKAASIAAISAAPQKVSFFEREAALDLEKLIGIDVRANQSRPVRRRRRRAGIPRWRY